MMGGHFARIKLRTAVSCLSAASSPGTTLRRKTIPRECIVVYKQHVLRCDETPVDMSVKRIKWLMPTTRPGDDLACTLLSRRARLGEIDVVRLRIPQDNYFYFIHLVIPLQRSTAMCPGCLADRAHEGRSDRCVPGDRIWPSKGIHNNMVKRAEKSYSGGGGER